MAVTGTVLQPNRRSEGQSYISDPTDPAGPTGSHRTQPVRSHPTRDPRQRRPAAAAGRAGRRSGRARGGRRRPARDARSRGHHGDHACCGVTSTSSACRAGPGTSSRAGAMAWSSKPTSSCRARWCWSRLHRAARGRRRSARRSSCSDRPMITSDHGQPV